MSGASRVENEIEYYRTVENIHALPDIFHFWSGRYLAPALMDVYGSADLQGIFADELGASLDRTGLNSVVSIGAGDGSVEIELAKRMKASGRENFQIVCAELSPVLIARGQARIDAEGLGRHVRFEEVNLTHWRPVTTYGAAFAHHSLHHIEALEHVFDTLKGALAPQGAFVTSDMIGRNGHMRWPEAEAVVQRVWKTMPERYRWNHQLKRREDEFVNWDCSGEGFEGIRAQDIMPELVKRFHFEKLCAWGGLTDIFIDRSFGHNLDPSNPEDTDFVDSLAKADVALNHAGAITPTNLIAVMRKEACELRSNNGLTAESCIRRPDPDGGVLQLSTRA